TYSRFTPLLTFALTRRRNIVQSTRDSAKSCPCEIGRCHRDSQQSNEQNVEKTCPYKMTKMATRFQQFQSLSSCTPLGYVKHALASGCHSPRLSTPWDKDAPFLACVATATPINPLAT